MDSVTIILPIVGLIVALGLASSPEPRGGEADAAWGSPLCLEAEHDGADGGYHEETVSIKNGTVVLAGRLFLPRTPGPHPAVVLLHGGGEQRLNEAPLFYAPLLARCGMAALVYDKRGTGASGGTWAAARFDDFVDDAAATVKTLTQRADIDARRIGLIGFSQGGRLAPVVAVRYGQVAFVVSVSGPFTSLVETRLYALEQRLRRWSFSGAALDSTMALWKKHFAAVVARDLQALTHLDDALSDPARRYGASILPPPSHRLPQSPIYNSMGRDYTAELHQLRIPMLAVWGDRDSVVPVQRSVAVLRGVLPKGGSSILDVKIVPFADHSFMDWTFSRRIKVEETIIEWILERLPALPAAPSKPRSPPRH